MTITNSISVSSSGKASVLKDPDATLDYTWDWSAWLADLTDTIVSFELLLDEGMSPAPTTPLVLVSSSATLTAVTAFISGGTSGLSEPATCRITTAGGRTDDRTIWLKIKDQ